MIGTTLDMSDMCLFVQFFLQVGLGDNRTFLHDMVAVRRQEYHTGVGWPLGVEPQTVQFWHGVLFDPSNQSHQKRTVVATKTAANSPLKAGTCNRGSVANFVVIASLRKHLPRVLNFLAYFTTYRHSSKI